MRNPALTLAALLLLAAGIQSGVVQAANTVGQITHLSGTLVAKRADGTTKLYAVKSEVQEGDTLSTERDTYARIKFADGGEVVLRPGSQLKVAAYSFKQDQPKEDNIFLDLLKGGLRAVTGLIGKRNRAAVKFGVVTATIGIRGTHFGALFCNNDCGGIPTVSGGPPANGLHTDTASGSIVISNAAGSIVVPAGSFSFTPSPTVAPKLVPPSEGIRVTMPPIISLNKTSGQGIGKTGDNECTVQ